MSGRLSVLSAGPGLTVQDPGRNGYLAYGLTRGGAADLTALAEGAALLGQSMDLAAIEMVGMGGQFEASTDITIALTGAPMSASLGGERLIWNATHRMPAGARLSVGGALSGVYGYLHVAGGIETPRIMGSRSSHLTAGVGATLADGDSLPVGSGSVGTPGLGLPQDNRFTGGEIRVVPSVQTEQFGNETLERFQKTAFRRDPRGNRQGVRMASDTQSFYVDGGLSIVSEVIAEGDIQITGDGAPYVLMCECQTTGGYPRIGTVVPADLPRVAQAPVGASLQFSFITLEEARAIEIRARADRAGLSRRISPLVRDPHHLPDLLKYQLVSGVVSATADPYLP